MTRRYTTPTAFLATMAMAVTLAAVLPAAWPAHAAETAVAPERNPPGDIPDDQVFVTFRAPQGFSLKVPEGWARRDVPSGVDFADKYGEIVVTITPASTAPTLAEVKSTDVVELAKLDRAVTVAASAAVKLPVGPAVKITFTSNSESNTVTGKRVRLENERFVIGGPGKRATLTLSAPAGADNADQWKLVAESFRWN